MQSRAPFEPPPSTPPDATGLLAKMYEEQLRLRRELDALKERGDGAEHDEENAAASEKNGEEDDGRPAKERFLAWRREHPKAFLGIVLGLAVLVVGVVALILYLRTYESTDDAEIDGNISSIAPRVGGVVTGVFVVDNQYVKQGDLIAELDRSDLDVALAKAEANLALAQAQNEAETPSVPITEQTNKTSIATGGGDIATAAAQLSAAEKDVESSKARVEQAAASSRLAQMNVERSQALVKSGAVSQADLDRKTAAAQSAEAELAAAQATSASASARVAQLQAQVGVAENKLEETRANAPKQVAIQRANVSSKEAQIKAAEAALAQARLNIGYAKIVAPVSGIIGKKAVNVGDHVAIGQPIVAIVQTDDLWVTANFKETQLGKMHPGQKVRVSVDAYGKTYDATVTSLPGASGAQFSLFPPENATGNYVKVVQRLPVRIEFTKGQPGLELLRPGMSVEPKVWLK